MKENLVQVTTLLLTAHHRMMSQCNHNILSMLFSYVQLYSSAYKIMSNNATGIIS
jgi:hypothetical protein